MLNIAIGTCSLCGGRVSVPDGSGSILKPRGQCEGCGALEAEHGPVIPMVPAQLPPVVSPLLAPTPGVVRDSTSVPEWQRNGRFW
jgi:hypothetical protein